MKNIKWSNIFAGILIAAAGILLIAYPYITDNDICTAIGGIVFIYGVLNIVRYFIYPIEVRLFRNDLIVGLLLVTIGIISFIFKEMFLEMTYIYLALLILYSGFMKFKDGIDASHLGSNHGMLYFGLAMISIILGLVVLFNTYIFSTRATEDFMHKLIGYGMIYSGLSDLFSAIYLSKKLKTYLKQKDIDIENDRLNEVAKHVEPVSQVQEEINNNSVQLSDESNIIDQEQNNDN